MVINNAGAYTVQMTHPKMAVIGFKREESKITLSAPEMPDITFDLPADTVENRRRCRFGFQSKTFYAFYFYTPENSGSSI